MVNMKTKKPSKRIFVFVDRDATLIYDGGNYNLGKQKDWRELIRILPGVVSGIKRLRKLKDVGIYMITNQPGVAVKEFPLLTLEKANSVCQEILDRLEDKGARIEGYRLCPHATLSELRRHPERHYDKRYIHKNCSCHKPHIGMIRDIVKDEGYNLSEVKIYTLGDRYGDVKIGINAGGYGILTPFKNREKHLAKVKKLKSRRKYIAKSFLDAVSFVLKREKN